VPLSRNLGTLTSWNPLGHSRTVTPLLYLYLYIAELFHIMQLILIFRNLYWGWLPRDFHYLRFFHIRYAASNVKCLVMVLGTKLDTEEEKNVGNYLPVDTASHPQKNSTLQWHHCVNLKPRIFFFGGGGTS